MPSRTAPRRAISPAPRRWRRRSLPTARSNDGPSGLTARGRIGQPVQPTLSLVETARPGRAGRRPVRPCRGGGPHPQAEAHWGFRGVGSFSSEKLGPDGRSDRPDRLKQAIQDRTGSGSGHPSKARSSTTSESRMSFGSLSLGGNLAGTQGDRAIGQHARSWRSSARRGIRGTSVRSPGTTPGRRPGPVSRSLATSPTAR